MRDRRKLWLDTRGVPVITTAVNGERNAERWGWTPATAVPTEEEKEMTTTEDFKKAPIGAMATHEDGARALKVDGPERRWILQNGLYLDDKEIEQWGYTLDPLPDPEPDWTNAPAVMAHAEDEEPHVWVNVDAQGWRDEHGKTRQWTALRDVDPLYPKGQDA